MNIQKQNINKRVLIQYMLLFGLLFCATSLLAKTGVGTVDYARGAVTAQHKQFGMRIMGKGAFVYEEDVITTGNRSFAIIKMADGTKMTVRPNSSLGIEKYIARKGRSDSAILNLFKGGIRAITGFISKRREDAYKIRTPVATIGIRGTEFDARLCSKDCGDDSKRYKKKDDVKTAFVIGRIAFLRGQISATDEHKKTRQLFTGGPLYEGDTLKTGLSSFAVLAFRDKSRITLNANSEFEIKKHHYNVKEPGLSSALMRLVKGGLRAVTGLIGKQNRDAYRMRTPVATIGVRGTGYDLQCEGDCVSEAQSLNTPLEKLLNSVIKPAMAALDGEGMYAHVWEGAIELKNNSGTKVLNTNQTLFVKNINVAPVIVPGLPLHMRSTPAPRPDSIKIEDNMFKTDAQKNTDPGLYVSVYEGHVSMATNQGTRIDLGKGEAAFAGVTNQQRAVPVRLPALPAFQINDAYPRPESFSESWENLFNEVTNTDENQDLQCVPQ